METLIIQVDCRPYIRKGGGPPQLGITVEGPSHQQKKQLKAIAKDYRSHDYHNLDDIQLSSNGKHALQDISLKTKVTNGNSTKYSTQLASTLTKGTSNVYNVSNVNDKQIHEGLQITHIQRGSIIDQVGQFRVGDIIVEVNGVNLERPFAEAQNTLKQFVIEHTSHGPLVLKVLRKPTSSTASIPSMLGSQITVVDHYEGSRQNSYRIQQRLHENLQPKLTYQQLADISVPFSEKASLVPNSPTTPKSPSTPSKTSRHLVGALNTRRIGTRYNIRLKKGPNGFGIKIAERDNMHGTRKRPIYITAITTIGSAYQDGQLKEGDMLLEVNGIDLQGKSQPEVTRMLKGVAIGEEVQLVVSRQNVSPDDSESYPNEPKNSKQSKSDINDDSLIDLNVPDQDDALIDKSNQEFEKRIDNLLNEQLIDGPGDYIYDIPLNDTKSAGLGLYLKYPRRSSDHKDLGIWIEKVITGGAAWKDGRLQPNDQILAINGITLLGLSNTEASETLTAAVCRGIGPEATPNTIRLEIQRRDPAIAAKVLQETDNRIEHSDVIKNTQDSSYKNSEKSGLSYQTAIDVTSQNRSTQLSVLDDSSSSSNRNSHDDSAMSPQTQASSSLKLSSYHDKQNNSDKTNETTSSAISQITDFTSVPISDGVTLEQQYNGKTTHTLPKSIDTETQNALKQNVVDTASCQSWDEESLDIAISGEEAFQRDGFGRQSISEKRHAQLNAKNTDTYKRNQKAKEEREKQRKLEQQLARQHLDEGHNRQTQQFYPIRDQQVTSDYYVSHGFKNHDEIRTVHDTGRLNDLPVDTYHREVPVDVQLPPTAKASNIRSNMQLGNVALFSNDSYEGQNTNSHLASSNPYQHKSSELSDQNLAHSSSQCLKCGCPESTCPCGSFSQQRHVAAMRSAYQIYGGISNPGFDHNILKRSNSLESVQQHQLRSDVIVPRVGTVRVARNRKVNESFRAAVDRSYECSTNTTSSRHDHSEISTDHRNASTGPSRIMSSITNTTVSTSNDEKYLIKNHKTQSNGVAQTTSKKSSLLTKFLKFGSMKKKKKNQQPSEMNELNDIKTGKSCNNQHLLRDHEQAFKSQPSKGSHSRAHSALSHSATQNHQRRNSHMSKQSESTMDGQMFANPNLKQQTVLQPYMQNGLDIQQQHRFPMPICQYQQPIMHNEMNNQFHNNQSPQSIGPQPKQNYQYSSLPGNQPVSNNTHIHHQQYAHIPLNHNQGPALMHTQPTNQQQFGPSQMTPANHIAPIDHIKNHPMHIQALSGTRDGRYGINPSLMPNGCSLNSNISTQWQSQQPVTNGLWVTNSPTTDSLQSTMQGIYGTLPMQQTSMRLPQASMETNYTISQTHQLPRNMMQQPCIAQMTGGPSATLQPTHHPIGQMPNQHYGMTNATGGAIHQNMQPQHVYYYDF